MNTFITRVELHGANQQDYDVLHDAMKQRMFHRTITGDDGINYQLPPAEYHSKGNIDIQDVRALAQAAAATTGKRSNILVSQYVNAAWTLPPVTESIFSSLFLNK